MAIWYLDPELGNDANTGTSMATAWKTLTAATTAKGVVFGDTVRVKASNTTITSIGSATWTNKSTTVTIPAGVIKNIDMCETAWIAANANVTSTVSSTLAFEGTNRLQLSIAAGFTTGKIAYKTLAVTEDFSAYEQISFFVRCNTAVASAFSIALCSDSIGDVVVDTISFNTIQNSTTNKYLVIVANKGSALGSAINSVAIYADSDPGTCVMEVDNIIACKAASSADALTLDDLVGLNVGTMPEWFKIKSINNTTLSLGMQNNWQVGSAQPLTWFGTSGSYTTYRLKGMINLVSNNQLGTPPVTVNISGGWDRTDMSTQVGLTWFGTNAALNNTPGGSISLLATVRLPLTMENIAIKDYGVYFDRANFNFENYGYYKNCYFSPVSFPGNPPMGSNIQGGTYENCVLTFDVSLNSGGLAGIYNNCKFRAATNFSGINAQPIVSNLVYTPINKFFNCDFYSCVVIGPNAVVDNSTIYLPDNFQGYSFTGYRGVGIFNNCTYNTNLTFPPDTENSNVGTVRITAFNKDPNLNFYADNYCALNSITDSNRRTLTGIGWRLRGYGTPFKPIQVTIANPYVVATKTVTIKAWVKTANADNAYPVKVSLMATPQLGIPVYTYSSEISPGNTYQQISLSFTPALSGVADIFIRAYRDLRPADTIAGNIGTIYIDDIEIV